MTEPKWWDATIPRGPLLKSGAQNPYEGFGPEELYDSIAKLGVERAVFGKEVGEGGYEHWQGRIVFKKGIALERLRMYWPIVHWTPTQVRDFDYCTKDGDYWCSWEGALREYQTMELVGWQNQVLEKVQCQNDRRVTVVVDERGACGKTTLAKIITARHLGAYCPALDDAKDYMAWALAHKTARIFCINIPKAEDRTKDKSLWSAVEQMKDGYLWDKRNHWQEAWIKPPKVLVLTNAIPNVTMLSDDRWQIGIMQYPQYAPIDDVTGLYLNWRTQSEWRRDNAGEP